MCKDRKKRREAQQIEDAKMKKQIKNCFSKISYPNKHAAEEAAKLLRKKFGHTQNVYHCKICGNYHITSQTKLRGKDKMIERE